MLDLDVHGAAHEALRVLRDEANPSKGFLIQWKHEQDEVNLERYGSHLLSGKGLSVREVKPEYSSSSPTMMGFEVMNVAFDSILARDPRVIAFGASPVAGIMTGATIDVNGGRVLR